MLWFLPNRGGLLALALALSLLTLSPAPAADENWTPLFDGETLGSWERVDTGGSGEVDIRDGAIRIAQGVMGSGIRYHAPEGEPFPTENYEIEFTAQRTAGTDFFAALTFPVGDSCCTFINGGWGGALVGLSNFLCTMAVGLVNSTDISGVLTNALWALGGGIVSGIL